MITDATGVIPMLQRQYSDSSDLIKKKLEAYLIDQPCEVCQGKRLKPEALSVRLGQYRILDTGASIQECHHRISTIQLIASSKLPIWYSEKSDPDCNFSDVGLDYLTSTAPDVTLSGAETSECLATNRLWSRRPLRTG